MSSPIAFLNRSLLISIDDSTRVGVARREASRLAEEAGLRTTGMEQVRIIATEACNNLVKHAKDGRVLLRALKSESNSGVEIVTTDSGPGILNIRRCLEDGYSTAGSPGTGLGAITRLSTVFDIYSQPGAGTVLLSQVWDRPLRPAVWNFTPAAVCVPRTEGDFCGDAWAVRSMADRCLIMVVDGLGHGIHASQAADAAVIGFLGAHDGTARELVEYLHGLLKPTRGASLAVADLLFSRNEAVYCGIGNIAAVLLGADRTRSLISLNGTLGHEVSKFKEFTYPLPPESTLVMHSDGLVSRWSLDAYPGMLIHHPSVIAAVMHRDFQRGRDDSTVLVARRMEERWTGAF